MIDRNTLTSTKGVKMKVINISPTSHDKDGQCLYRNVCVDKGCACALLDKPFDRAIYDKMREEAEEEVEELYKYDD